VPTLVLRRRGDRVAPPAGSLALAAGIPGARLVELDGDAHAPWAGDCRPLCAELERFVAGKVPGRSGA
jgi:pimeloyl-ACP methyl ester carboxylesterase